MKRLLLIHKNQTFFVNSLEYTQTRFQPNTEMMAKAGKSFLTSMWKEEEKQKNTGSRSIFRRQKQISHCHENIVDK